MQGCFHSGGGVAVAGDAELMHDVLGDFARGALFAVEENIGLAVEGFALVKEFFDAGEGIGRAEERTMGLVANAGEDGFGRGPEAI
jgi:hypothetical protein